jgi:fanconi anemia group J protein
MFSSLCSFIKILFVSEPKGSTEELEPVLEGYYDTILGKASVKKGRGGAKQFVKNRVTKNSTQESTKAGAALLAVCRGKVLLFYSTYLYCK